MTFSLYRGAIRYGYGQLWVRPGLDLRQRMIVAIAGFTSATLHDSLRKFAVSALNVDLTKDQVAEAAIQTAPWNGLPIALDGLAEGLVHLLTDDGAWSVASTAALQATDQLSWDTSAATLLGLLTDDARRRQS